MMDANRFWIVVATRTSEHDGWRRTEQVPTFVLDGWVQGITTPEHATRVAADIIGPGANVSVALMD